MIVIRKHKLQQFFTPEYVAALLVKQLPDGFIPENVIDLALGEGILLKKCRERWPYSKYFGVDIDPEIVKNNCYLNKLRIFIGDSLKEETINKIIGFNGGKKFDLAIGNPPFKYINNKPYFRIEGFFLEQYKKVVRESGYLVILLPDGILSNIENESIRKYILDNFSVIRITSLPERIFANTDTKISLLLLRKGILNKKTELIKVDNNLNIIQKKRVERKKLLRRMDVNYHIHNEIQKYNYPLIKVSRFIEKFIRGYTVYGDNRFFVSKGRKYLHSYHINEIGISYKKNNLFIEKGSIMDSDKAYVKLNDLVMVRVGRNKAGLMAVVNDLNLRGVASDCINIIRVKDISPYYFVLFFKTSYGKKLIKSIIHGSCVNIISKRDFLSLKIPVIPEDRQRYYEKNYRKILYKYKTNTDMSIINNELDLLIGKLEKTLGG